MIIRPAEEQELERVSVLRKQVNDLHVEGKPSVFKANFYDGLSDYIYEIQNDDKKEIIVAINEGEICVVEVDKSRCENVRRWWPFFRDRRIDAFEGLTKRFLD